MEESNFKEELDDYEVEIIRDTISDLIDSLVKLNQAEFTAADVRSLIGECDWAGKMLFSILFVNGELCGCDDDHDHNED